MEKLYTTKQIAEMYEVSPYTITQNWCNKGLKFIRGKDGMMYRVSWVEKFLEEEAERQAIERSHKEVIATQVKNITIKPYMLRRNFNKEMKIV